MNEVTDATQTDDQWSSEINQIKLLQWMDQRGLESGPITNAILLEGGTQNILQKFDRGDRTFVLRRPPIKLRNNSNEAMLREARVLAAIGDANVPHPKFIDAAEDDSAIGVAFYLMEFIDGFNPGNGLPENLQNNIEAHKRMGYSWVEAIANLGAIDYQAVGLEGFGKPEGYLERQTPRWLSQLESYQQFSQWPGVSGLPDVKRITDWLDNNRPSSFIPGILHGDCHIANTMFDKNNGELLALIDWELSTIGDPLLDLGWMMATLPDEDGRSLSVINMDQITGLPNINDLVAHYKSLSERDLSHIEWYAVLACFKLAVILEGTHARACGGKAPKEVGNFLHQSAVELLEKAHHKIN